MRHISLTPSSKRDTVVVEVFFAAQKELFNSPLRRGARGDVFEFE
jgi:hypothetical protein